MDLCDGSFVQHPSALPPSRSDLIKARSGSRTSLDKYLDASICLRISFQYLHLPHFGHTTGHSDLPPVLSKSSLVPNFPYLYTVPPHSTKKRYLEYLLQNRVARTQNQQILCQKMDIHDIGMVVGHRRELVKADRVRYLFDLAGIMPAGLLDVKERK